MYKYHYDVKWSDEDKQFVATCREFPSLSWLTDSEDDALEGIKLVVSAALKGGMIPKFGK